MPISTGSKSVSKPKKHDTKKGESERLTFFILLKLHVLFITFVSPNNRAVIWIPILVPLFWF